jgi:hypothetical protein
LNGSLTPFIEAYLMGAPKETPKAGSPGSR